MAPQLGRYQLEERLGAGGFATVWRAVDPVLGREIAIKVLDPQLAADPPTRSRFTNEGRALARIRHPNVVQVHDAGEAEGNVFIAMELVRGISLGAILHERGPLALHDVHRVLAGVAEALEAIHAAGLVHRDVKPANIMLEAGTGRTVLLDLGIARASGDATVSSVGQVVGTPGYLAPEQVDPSMGLGPRTDVYQLAATAYSLLTGVPPFQGEAFQAMYLVMHSEPRNIGELRPDLPPAARDAIMAGLAKDPAARPPGPRALIAQLHGQAAPAPPTHVAAPATRIATPAQTAAARQAGTMPPGAVPRQAPAAAPGGGRKWLIVAGLAVVAIAGGGAFYMLSGSGGGDPGSVDDADGSETPGASGSAPAGGTNEARGSATDLKPDGDPVTLTIPSSKQPVRLRIAADAGQRVSVQIWDVNSSLHAKMLASNGSALAPDLDISGEGLVVPIAVPAGGYVLVLSTEPDTEPVGATVQAFAVPPDVAGTLTVAPTAVEIKAPGHQTRLEFAGPAEGRAIFLFSAMSSGARVTLLGPRGERLIDSEFVESGDTFFGPFAAAAGAKHTMVLTGEGTATPNGNVALQPVPADTEGQITLGGAAASVALAEGQVARLTFDAKPGDLLDLVFGGERAEGNVTVLGPDGIRNISDEYFSAGDRVSLQDIPVAGVHTAIVTGASRPFSVLVSLRRTP